MNLGQDRKLAAIMFTDIVGYTSMMSKDESKAVGLLKKKESALKPLISTYNGNLVKNIGDGTLSYYNSAIDAVRCSIELQKSFQDNRDFKIRVGIHLGDIMLENNDIFGDGVNIASRLESMAQEGSILISKEVNDQLINHSEFDTIPLGLQSLKGVGRLIDVYGLKNKDITVPNPDDYTNNLIDHHNEDDGVPSVAIIPFENKGQDEDVFYSYGISAGLTKKCSQAGMIRVESLKEIQKIKNHSKLSARELGKILSVQYIVSGTLWKVGDVFQLSIEVYNAKESKIIWSDHFEEAWDNLSDIKTKLADGVLKTLAKKNNLSNRNINISSEAYKYHLKANYQYNIRQNSEDTEIVRSQYKKAIKLAPNFIDARVRLGVTYLETGDYAKAKEIYKKAIEKSELINDMRGKANSFGGLGNIHWHKGRYDKSLENLYISLDILKELNDQTGISRSLLQIGHNYYYKGEWDKAYKYYLRSIEIIDKMQDRHNMGKALLSLGNIYEAKKEIDKALDCYKEASGIFIEFNDKYAQGYAQMGIGNMYKKLKKYDEAIEFYQSALKTRKDIEDKSGIAMLKHNIAVIFKEIYDYPSALDLFKKALEITQEIGDQHSSSVILKNIGEIYRIKGKYKKSINVHEKSLKIRMDLEQNEYIGESLNQLILTHYLDNDLVNVSDYLKKLKKIDIKDDDQCALRDLYNLIINDKPDDNDTINEIVENVEGIENISYETYYFLHQVSKNDKYLDIAKDKLNEIQSNHTNSLDMIGYPIPRKILESN